MKDANQATIRVLNPNSNEDVTQGLRDALASFAMPGVAIDCATLASGPFGIETERHTAEVAAPLVDDMLANPADAHVIACYSDPGLALARAEVPSPVFGIQESAVAVALTRGTRFGVIAISDKSIPRHIRSIQAMGLIGRLAGERALNASVAESAGAAIFDRLVDVGKSLQTQDGADVIILGCAGMARHRAGLEAELGCPVIDPAQAAVTSALGVVMGRA